MERALPELAELEEIIDAGSPDLEASVVVRVQADGGSFPLYVLTLGHGGRETPAVGFFGGVHGLERIGTQVLLVFLRTLLLRLKWDQALRRQLESVRMVFMPLINPGGMWGNTRCNPQGVDLMRNAPLEAKERVPFLVGGHRLGRRLPWYRGAPGAPMEAEGQAICRVVETELLSHRFSLALDCHSGFGLRDRIWFPYAHSTEPMPHLAEVQALKSLFDRSCPSHRYLFEPQSNQYLAHGDMWDYLYLQAAADRERVFLPFTLEMGSWLWITKNPRQLFSRLGLFNPLKLLLRYGVLHGHLAWLDFFVRAATEHQRWQPREEERASLGDSALKRWYGGGRRP